VSKRTAALAVAIALVIGGAIGFAGHAPGRSSTWTDIRTWVGFAVVVIGVVIALVQLELQRRQLAEQQRVIKGEIERNTRRDALLDGQLRELEQRARTLDRQQAEEVDLRPGTYSTEVANGSRRPIRNVACRVEVAPGDGLQEARRAGRYAELEVGAGPVLVDVTETPRVEFVRAGEAGAFIFEIDPSNNPEARMTARFTDDAGLHWEINHDLHLEPLTDRSDW
jgi:hypothetical protein